MVKVAGKLEDAVKGLFVPGRLFEDLGFRYVGPSRVTTYRRCSIRADQRQATRRPILPTL